MRIVEYVDKNDYKRRRVVRDNDPDELAKHGQPLEPPDLDRLDWEKLKKQLYHELLSRDLTCWRDVQYSQTGLTSAILATFRKVIKELYKKEV